MTFRLAALVFGLALSAACAPAVAANGKTLEKIDTKVGSGRLAMTGNVVTIHYTGWLYAPKRPDQHGTKIDSSRDTKAYFFKLGAGSVIKGWDEGVTGMKVGGKRTLIVPAAMAFGKNGRGSIPPASNMIFDIELMDVM